MGASVCGDTGPRTSQTAPVGSVRLLACPAEGARGPRRRIEGTSLSVARTHDRAPRVPPAASPPAQRYHLSTAPALGAADRQLPPLQSLSSRHPGSRQAAPAAAGSRQRRTGGQRPPQRQTPPGPPQRSAAGTAPSQPSRENCQGSAAVRRIGPRRPRTPTSVVPGTTTSPSPAPAGALPCGRRRSPAPCRRAGRCRKEGPGAGAALRGSGRRRRGHGAGRAHT